MSVEVIAFLNERAAVQPTGGIMYMGLESAYDVEGHRKWNFSGPTGVW